MNQKTFLTYETWRKIGSDIPLEPNKKTLEVFERQYPQVVAQYKARREEESEQMKEILKITDEEERLKKIAKLFGLKR